MAKPINHDTSSSLTTAAWETAKGGLKGALLITGIAALAGGIVVGGAAAGIAALAGSASVTAVGLIAGIAAAVITGLATALGGGTAIAVGTGGGALLGLAKGNSRIGREQQLYDSKVARKQHRDEIRVNDAGMAGMQQGYQMGFAEGQQAVVNQLRALQEQQLMAQTMQQRAAASPGHASKIMQQREAQANVPPQRG